MATILLVDDIPDCARPLAHMLRRAGHEVAFAGNGLEALTSLDAVWPDLVVTDLTMPVMDGLALLRALGDCPAYRGRLPVVLLTAWADPSALAAAHELGATAVLVKSDHSADELLRAISHHTCSSGSGHTRN
jgi:CheY-like chemotaxis protein